MAEEASQQEAPKQETPPPLVFERISYSAWQVFRKGCQHRFYLDNIEKKRQNVHGVHLDFGSAIHGAIERYRTRKNPVSVDEAVDIFRWGFCLLFGDHVSLYEKKDQEQDPEFFLQAGEHILRHFHECKELADAEVVYNEHRLEVPIERTDGDVTFKGFIDMVIKTRWKRGETLLYIVDFKSCSWGWGREKFQDKDLQSQLFLYKHFLCKKFNLSPDLVRCAFVLLKKRPRPNDCPVQFIPVSAGPTSVQRTLDNLSSDITEIKQRLAHKTFRKNRGECINSFGQKCPYLNTQLCPGE